jgi:hypothetical protein
MYPARVRCSCRPATSASSLSVTTEHTLTVDNVRRYRSVYLWIVAVSDQAHPEAIYEIAPLQLEPYFNAWEERLGQRMAALQYTSIIRRFPCPSSRGTAFAFGRQAQWNFRGRSRKR